MIGLLLCPRVRLLALAELADEQRPTDQQWARLSVDSVASAGRSELKPCSVVGRCADPGPGLCANGEPRSTPDRTRDVIDGSTSAPEVLGEKDKILMLRVDLLTASPDRGRGQVDVHVG